MHAKATLAVRLILGFIFLLTSTNGILMLITGKGFLPMPPPSPEILVVMGGISALKYLLPLVKIIELTSAIFLLSGRFINLSIVLLAPVVVNILCVHIFIEQSGLPFALVITVLLLILIKTRWQYFKPLLLIK